LEKEIIPSLLSAGLISEDRDPNDKRKKIFYPTVNSNLVSNGDKSQNNIRVECGVKNSGSPNQKRLPLKNGENKKALVSGDLIKRLSLAEVLEKLRCQWIEGTEEEFLALAQENGLTLSEAKSLFERLKGNELFWFDRDEKTLWKWVR
jgi:hypothetical protein